MCNSLRYYYKYKHYIAHIIFAIVENQPWQSISYKILWIQKSNSWIRFTGNSLMKLKNPGAYDNFGAH